MRIVASINLRFIVVIKRARFYTRGAATSLKCGNKTAPPYWRYRLPNMKNTKLKCGSVKILMRSLFSFRLVHNSTHNSFLAEHVSGAERSGKISRSSLSSVYGIPAHRSATLIWFIDRSAFAALRSRAGFKGEGPHQQMTSHYTTISRVVLISSSSCFILSPHV